MLRRVHRIGGKSNKIHAIFAPVFPVFPVVVYLFSEVSE